LRIVIDKIEAITREPGCVYTLALLLLRDLFFVPEKATDINWHDHLNIQEITFLVGLLVKTEIDLTAPSEEDSAKRFDEIYRLFIELHKEHHGPFLKRLAEAVKGSVSAETKEEHYRHTFGAGEMMTEPIFYSGSGAYDFQYLDYAVSKYSDDSVWIKQYKGIDLPEMVSIARELKRLHEHKCNKLLAQHPVEFSELCKAALAVFCFEERDLQQFGTDSVKAFINTFSLEPGKVNVRLELPGQYNQLQSHPIARLSDGRYFLPVCFNLSEALYEGPFYWMNRDLSYADTALLHRGQFSQNATARLLKSVFGNASVYTEVEIRGSKGHTITDIDVLALCGNKAVIAQVKSKRLTELARLGDQERLITDFRLAVQEAYDQGLSCRRALLGRANKLFVNGKQIHLSESIDDAYVLCVTADHYPAVTHQVDIFLKKQPADPSPIALSIFDLDILAFYLEDAFQFAYYLRQRTALSTYFKADSEMSLLGFHLTHKLFKAEEAEMQVLDNSYAQLIDGNYPVLRGSLARGAPPDKLHQQWANEEFQSLVDQAKSTSEPRFTDVVFF
jgi:hypothetical protein